MNCSNPSFQVLFVRRYLSSLNKTENVTEEEVDAVIKEIRAYTLASHMFWGIWSVFNSVMTTIEFDYWVGKFINFYNSLDHL